MHAEALVFGGESIEVLLEKDILGRNVGEDEVDLGGVTSGAATDDGAHNLQHGRDTSAASNHTKMPYHVRRVDEGTLGPLDADRLAHSERRHVLADIARGVRLDQKVEVARLVVTRDGRIRTYDLLGRAIGLLDRSADRDVLADGESEDRVVSGKGEAVAGIEVLAAGLFHGAEREFTLRRCAR